jgi:hypothetical protein
MVVEASGFGGHSGYAAAVSCPDPEVAETLLRYYARKKQAKWTAAKQIRMAGRYHIRNLRVNVFAYFRNEESH